MSQPPLPPMPPQQPQQPRPVPQPDPDVTRIRPPAGSPPPYGAPAPQAPQQARPATPPPYQQASPAPAPYGQPHQQPHQQPGQQTGGPQGVQEFRIGQAQIRNMALRFGLATVAVAVLVFLPNRRTEDWNTLGKVLLVVLALVVMAIVLALLPVKVTLAPQGLTVQRLSGLKKFVPGAEIGRAVLVEQFQAYDRAGTGVSTRLYLRNHDGKRILVLNSQQVDRSAQVAVAQALGQQNVDHVPDPVNGKELSRRYPGMVSVWEARPVLIGVVAAIVIVAAVVVGVLLFADY